MNRDARPCEKAADDEHGYVFWFKAVAFFLLPTAIAFASVGLVIAYSGCNRTTWATVTAVRPTLEYAVCEIEYVYRVEPGQDHSAVKTGPCGQFHSTTPMYVDVCYGAMRPRATSLIIRGHYVPLRVGIGLIFASVACLLLMLVAPMLLATRDRRQLTLTAAHGDV